MRFGSVRDLYNRSLSLAPKHFHPPQKSRPHPLAVTVPSPAPAPSTLPGDLRPAFWLHGFACSRRRGHKVRADREVWVWARTPDPLLHPLPPLRPPGHSGSAPRHRRWLPSCLHPRTQPVLKAGGPTSEMRPSWVRPLSLAAATSRSWPEPARSLAWTLVTALHWLPCCRSCLAHAAWSYSPLGSPSPTGPAPHPSDLLRYPQASVGAWPHPPCSSASGTPSCLRM